jgi:hypothetical protein
MLASLAAVVAAHLDGRLAALDVVRDARPVTCQLGDREPCLRPAELKVADPWGDSAWGCLNHVEEVLLSASSVFVADESMSGLAAYLRRGRRADTCGHVPSPGTPAASA